MGVAGAAIAGVAILLAAPQPALVQSEVSQRAIDPDGYVLYRISVVTLRSEDPITPLHVSQPTVTGAASVEGPLLSALALGTVGSPHGQTLVHTWIVTPSPGGRAIRIAPVCGDVAGAPFTVAEQVVHIGGEPHERSSPEPAVLQGTTLPCGTLRLDHRLRPTADGAILQCRLLTTMELLGVWQLRPPRGRDCTVVEGDLPGYEIDAQAKGAVATWSWDVACDGEPVVEPAEILVQTRCPGMWSQPTLTLLATPRLTIEKPAE